MSVPYNGDVDPHTITKAELERMDKLQVDNNLELEMQGIKISVKYLEPH